MIVLAIDPGVTTGWAVLDADGKVQGTGNLRVEDLEESLTYIISLARRNGHEVGCILEEFPLAASGRLATELREVVKIIENVLSASEIEALRVTPGVWKTSAVGVAGLPETHWDGDRLTTHQRDAIKMGRYYLGHLR